MAVEYLLLETGDKLLLEDGGGLLLESSTAGTTFTQTLTGTLASSGTEPHQTTKALTGAL